ncbi:MAG: twin-arginine translocase subunit TatC [Acidimicrobiia bacterium]|nr:twin-arginine translocase subunit TatC [Acidimicrobiia bacterium]MDH5288814.1 twin-arginine translocase subunit TatC [Acidimicrobiia bacterium]
MTLVGHLSELRTRLIRAVLAIVLGSLLVYVLNNRIIHVLQAPYCDLLESKGRTDCEFLIRKPLENFSVVLSISGYGGLILAMPVVLYQLARFVLPGLYPQEKRMLIPFVSASFLLLMGGIAGGYFLMPKTLSVLASFGPDSFVPLFEPGEYFSFFIKMLLAFGLAAETPLVLVFLQLIGVLKPQTLRSNRRIAAVVVVFLAAVITPTGDPFTLLVVAIPMYFFYEISIVIGWRLVKGRHVRIEA